MEASVSNRLHDLQTYALEHLGVCVALVSEETYKAAYEAAPNLVETPFNPHRMGILIGPSEACLVISTDALNPSVLGAAIHELGHICVAGNLTSPEWDFLGWEFALATTLGCVPEWLDSHKSYSLTTGDTLGDLSAERLDYVLDERLQVVAHLLDSHGRPLPKHTPWTGEIPYWRGKWV